MPDSFILIVRHADGTTQRRTLGAGAFTVGREPDCGVVIESADVSRHHARLILGADSLQIVDLGSTLGTKVNGHSVRGPTREAYPVMIQLGSVNISVKLATGEADHQLRGDDAAPPVANPDAHVPYEFGNEIARGGMGSILEAQDCKLGRKVAVKIMLSELDADADQQQRFIHEAAVLGRLEHPNIVPIHDIGRDSEGQLYYSMKLVKGRTLQSILNGLSEADTGTASQYTLDRLLTIFRKVCDAMAFSHAHGIIHRDLKPENIMVGEFGEVLVMDWGLAKFLHEDRALISNLARSGAVWEATLVAGGTNLGMTMDGDVMGTPQFMSPEQAEGRIADMDARSDIWSLGGILYAILTLRPPVEGTTLEEILQKVASGGVTSLTRPTKQGAGLAKSRPKNERHLASAAPRLIPPALSAVTMKALSVAREKRYQNVAALTADIEAYQNGFATSAENAGAWKQLKLFVKRNKAASIGIAAVLVLSAAFTAKVLGEKNRAERMLAELRGTAPTFEAQSHALLSQGSLDDALAKIGYAVGLAPDNADYHLARAHLFQSTQRLSEAEAEYRRVLELRPDDRAAKANLDVCEKLLAENGGATQLPMILQNKLLDALIAQHRDLEAAPLSQLLNRDGKTAEATILARLASYSTQKGWGKYSVRRAGSGFKVSLAGLQLGDLNALHGLPIGNLVLNQTSVTDLGPLAGLPLDTLSLNNTRVSDLSPLRGIKLGTLEVSGTDISDLSPLAGMPLKVLDIGNNKNLHEIKPLAGMSLDRLVADNLTLLDISPLRGIPLRELILNSEVKELPDFLPLAHSPTLEKIGLPWHISDITFIATMPKLQQVDFHFYGSPVNWVPVRDFLAKYGPDVPQIRAARVALATAGLKDLPIWRVYVEPDHQLRLDLYQTTLSDLAPLRGLAIKQLIITTTGVSDLEPLRGMPIHDLNLASTKVRDLEPLHGMPVRFLNLSYLNVSSLEPLRGMPLVKLNVHGTNVHDVGILAEFRDLEEIVLPVENPTNVELLRKLPKLRYLSFRWDAATNRPAQTASQFWKEYDAQHTAGKK